MNEVNIGLDELGKELGYIQLWDRERLNQLYMKPYSVYDWCIVSKSNKVKWSKDILIEFHNVLDWKYLVQNNSIPWSLDFCKQIREVIKWDEFSEYLIFYGVCEEEMILFLEEFKEELNWYLFSANENLNYSLIFEKEFSTKRQDTAFKLFKQYWSPGRFSRNKSIWGFQEVIIEQLGNELNWTSLSENPSFKWTEDLIENYKDDINWSSISKMPMDNIPWSIDFLEKFENEVDWHSISHNNSIDFSFELITKFEHRWQDKSKFYYSSNGDIHYPSQGNYWGILSKNLGYPYDLELLKKYRDKWNWNYLLRNENKLVNSDLIDVFAKEICKLKSEDMLDILHVNRNISFSSLFLDSIANSWKICYFRDSTRRNGFYYSGEWFEYSNNNNITPEIVKKFGKYLNVRAIIDNANLKWDISLIKSIINIEIPLDSSDYKKGYEGGFIYKQNFINREVGFERTKENIIKELKKKDYVKDILFETLLNSYI